MAYTKHHCSDNKGYFDNNVDQEHKKEKCSGAQVIMIQIGKHIYAHESIKSRSKWKV